MRKDSEKFLEILLNKRGELGQDSISCDIDEFMEIPNVKFNVKAVSGGTDEYIINNFCGSVSNIQLQQGTVNSTQTQTITNMKTLDFDKVSEFVTKIKKYDTLLEDEYGDKAAEVRQKITEIDTLVQKKENPSKVKGLLMELKNLSVGVAGSLIATGIVEGIKLLFI